MTWPSSDVPTTNLDAGTDNPQTARADLLSLAQAVNLLRNHFSTFMRGLAEAVDGPAARTAIGAADAADTVSRTSAQTVGGLKTFSDGHLSTSATQPIGYGAGAGGTVTQLTSKSTAVTHNKPMGRIVLHGELIAANGTFTFRVNNSCVDFYSCIVLSNGGLFDYQVTSTGSGFFDVRGRNLTGAGNGSQPALNFAVIAGTVT